MKISIAMATYNGAAHIGEQLASFTIQSRLPNELVVSDDGSTDDTVALLEQFADQAPFPVHIYRNDRTLGYAQNFNNALAHCSGDLVFLSDQDDAWHAHKLETVAAIAADDLDHDVFLNDAELADGNLNPSGLTLFDQTRALGLAPENLIMGCCVAARSSFLSLILPIPPDFRAHDSWIVEIAAGLKRYRLIPECLQTYRRHSGAATSHDFSQPRKASRLAFLHGRLTGHLKGGFADRLAWRADQVRLVFERVQALDGASSLDHSRISQFAADLAQEIEALDARRRLLRKGRLLRLGPLFRIWAGGGYRHFNGLATALKDLIRARETDQNRAQKAGQT